MKRIALVTLVATVTFASFACVPDPKEPMGGEELFDSAPPVAPKVDAGPVGTDITFTSLYNDYFANTQRASCAGNGACHGAEGESGSSSSSFVCPLNDKATCYRTMTGASGLVPAGGGGDPKQTFLFSILRKDTASGGNRMPKSPFTFSFSDADMQRITGWIAAGAKDD